MKRGRGRPTKRTREVEQILLRAVGEGLSFNAAAKLADISARVLREWRQHDPVLATALDELRRKGRRPVAA